MQLDHFPGSFFGPPTLVDLLRHRATHQGNQLAYTYLVDGETQEVSLSYAELDRKARAVAAWLESRDLHGQRALLLFPAGLDFIVNFFGCLYAGVVAVPVYPPRMNRTLDRIHAIASDAEAQVALTTQAVLDRVQPQLDQAPDLKSLRWLASDRIPPGMEKSWREPAVRSDTLAFLQYTSGSTGTPKGVMLSHSNLLHNCALIAHAFELTRSGVGVFWLPNYHDMGLVGGILQPLYEARPNVLMAPVAFLQRPFRWLQAISRYRGTTSGGPNFAYDLCVRKITAEQRATLDLSCWSVAFNGAEPVRADTLDRFAETFAECGFRREAFYPCYGLAEATLLVSGGFKQEPPTVNSFQPGGLENGLVSASAADDPGGRRLVSSGQNLPDQRIVIADPETRMLCEPDQVGEIWISGPSIAQGYWKRREETELTFRAFLADTGDGPFLRTGDLGFFHERNLFVAGRLKDLILIRGVNHYPQDIELTVEKSHPGIRPGCGAAFTIDDEADQRLVIVFEVERQQEGCRAEILEALKRDVSREHELVVDEAMLIRMGSIPKTSSGKIQRHACRHAFLNGSLDVVGHWSSRMTSIEESDEEFVETLPPLATLDEIALELGANGHGLLHENAGSAESSAASGAETAGGELDDGVLDDEALKSATARAAGPSPLAREPKAAIPAETPASHSEVIVPPAKGFVAEPGGMHAAGAAAAFEQRAESVSPTRNGHVVGRAAKKPSTAEVVLEEVRRVAKERAKGLTLESKITELGLDSLERVDILTALEDRYGGRRFPDELLPDLETCRQVVDAVEQYLDAGQGPSARRSSSADVSAENCRFDRYPEYLALKKNLDMVEASGLGNPFFNVHERVTNDTTQIAGRELINFSSYNYVGMSGDPEVGRAAKEAIDRYGTSVSASRLVSGEKPLHRDLERAIADLIGAEDAIVYVGGHSTNETTIGHLFGPGDLILHDALAHNSIIQGCVLSGARRRSFPHNDWRAVDELLSDLRGEYRRVLIAIEGVYSMDGDIPDLPRFIEVRRRHKAFLMVDEAHSAGVLGAHGRGIGEHFDVHPADVDLWMGTLSKSFGSCGGYIAGCLAVIEYLKYTSPGFVYSVGMSPPNAAAALAAIQLLQVQPERVTRLRERGKLFLSLAKKRRLNTGMSKDSPVIPIILGDSLHCMQLSRALGRRGINVQPIVYPAVEERASRLRFFITANHTEEQIRIAVDAVAEELRTINPKYFSNSHLHVVHTNALRAAPR